MSFSTSDPMSAPSRGSEDAAMDFAKSHGAQRLDAIGDFLYELWLCCRDCQLDFALLVAQSAHETANWSSKWWVDRLNPAGIGITGDDAQNAASGTWANGTEAARAQTVHMCAYVFGGVPSGYEQYIELDPRYDAVFEAGYNGDVTLLSDLGDGAWATDPDYAEGIAAKANAIFGEEEPMSEVVFGLVPKPKVTINHLDYGNPMIGYSSTLIVIEAVVWHRMIGNLWGTDDWFEQGNAATAYGVGVLSMDGAANDGLIIEWIDPKNGHYYGESSGPVSDPYGDGLLYWQRFGTDRVNPQSVAIEISGYETTPLTEKSRQAIAALSAYFADRREIPWNEFPMVPGQDRSFIIWHQEITYGTGKTCPAEVVMNETNDLIERTAGIMRQYQEVAAPVDEMPAAEPFDSFQHGLETQTDQHDGPDLYQYLERRFTVAPERTGTMRVSPDAELEVIKTLPAGKQIRSAFVTRQDDIDWILDTDGYSWKANSMNPKLTLPLKNQPT